MTHKSAKTDVIDDILAKDQATAHKLAVAYAKDESEAKKIAAKTKELKDLFHVASVPSKIEIVSGLLKKPSTKPYKQKLVAEFKQWVEDHIGGRYNKDATFIPHGSSSKAYRMDENMFSRNNYYDETDYSSMIGSPGHHLYPSHNNDQMLSALNIFGLLLGIIILFIGCICCIGFTSLYGFILYMMNKRNLNDNKEDHRYQQVEQV